MPGFASTVTFLDKLQGIVIVHQDFDDMLLFFAFPCFRLMGFSPLYQGVY